ncbi:MAG: deoxyguanosinetriphosphate triphosphohydrolase [Pseudomonadota bacterium]
MSATPRRELPHPSTSSWAAAADPLASRGRVYPEPACPMRSPWQRDRDRVIHSTAFRRLTYKTQVFVYHEGDHFRTRLTHTLEVAQITRAMARMLGLNEDLAEAIALAHDLGHPPFGHTGERALDEVMAHVGGYDHNAQSLRVVTQLERKYAEFDGLNLSWETREGLIKHNGPQPAPTSPFLAAYLNQHDMQASLHASAEAQVAAVADDIAYYNHDLDDGLRAGLLALDDLREVPLVAAVLEEVRTRHPALAEPRTLYEVNRRLITRMIEDVVAGARKRIARLEPRSADDIRSADRVTVTFSPAMQEQITILRAFLYAEVYRHPRVMAVMGDAAGVVHDLFVRYRASPELMSGAYAAHTHDADADAIDAVVCDFVAGMTDRFALSEHRRLFDDTPDLR